MMRRLLPWIAAVSTCALLGAAPLLNVGWVLAGYVSGFLVVVAALAWASHYAPQDPREAPPAAKPTTEVDAYATAVANLVSMAEHRERLQREVRDAQRQKP